MTFVSVVLPCSGKTPGFLTAPCTATRRPNRIFHRDQHLRVLKVFSSEPLRDIRLNLTHCLSSYWHHPDKRKSNRSGSVNWCSAFPIEILDLKDGDLQHIARHDPVIEARSGRICRNGCRGRSNCGPIRADIIDQRARRLRRLRLSWRRI